MHIVPLGRLGSHAAMQGAVPRTSVQIKLAARAHMVHPGDLTVACRVSSPWRVSECNRAATITSRDASGDRGTRFAELVARGHGVGQLTYLATRGPWPSDGASLLPVKVSGVDTAALKFSHLRNMVAAADDMSRRQRLARQSAFRAPEPARDLERDLPLTGQAGGSFSVTGSVARLEQSHRLSVAAGGDLVVSSKPIVPGVPKSVAGFLVHLQITRDRINAESSATRSDR